MQDNADKEERGTEEAPGKTEEAPGKTEEASESTNLNEEIEKYNVSVKLKEVNGWLGEIPILQKPALVINKPQSGKTRGVIRSFLNTARKGWVLIYGVSSHSEAASVIKHYVDYQKEKGWRNQTLLVVAAGINRYCPRYSLIKKERKKKEGFRQTDFCKEKCPLWNTTIPERLLEPIDIERQNFGEGNKKIIMAPFNFRVLANHYKKIAEDASLHIILVGSDRDLKQIKDKNMLKGILKIEGCMRAVLLKKSIDTTGRNPDGTFNSKKRRKSVFAGPTIIVAPHELIPLLLTFARAYSHRVLLVIDEFDRMLTKKIPRELAEKFEENLGKPKEWAWYEALTNYSPADEVDEKLIIKAPKLVQFKKIILEKDENGKAVRTRVVEVPLLTIVTRKLVELKEKGKLKNVIVVGSSIPLLPMQVLRYLVKWIGYLTRKRTVSVYYSDITLPEKKLIVLYRTDVRDLEAVLWKVRKGDVMVIAGTLENALSIALELLLNRTRPDKYLEFKRLMDSETFDKWVRDNCRVFGGESTKKWHGCRVGRRFIIYFPMWVSIVERRGKDEYYNYYISGTMEYIFDVPKNYIDLGRVKITWLGGRQMRGVMLPPSVKVLFFMTNGKYNEEGGIEKYRLNDLLQAIYRINSKEDVYVVMDTLTELLLKLIQKIYSWHINQLAYI